MPTGDWHNDPKLYIAESQPMKDPIVAYAQAGFRLFALSGKKPASKDDWTQTVFDPLANRQKIPGNFGVIVGQEYIIIDVDTKNKAKGKESFAKLTNDAGLADGWEAQTFVVRTGSGGFHVYLKKPIQFTCKKNVKVYPGIDFLSGNAYVVGAGSVHPDTTLQYEPVCQSPNDVLSAPATLLELCKAEPPAPRNDTEAVIDDDPLNIERFKNLLSNMPEVGDGQKSNSIYLVACKGRDLGLSESICSATIQSDYNGVKIANPVPLEDVEVVVGNAYRYAKGQIGNKNVSAMFKVVEVGETIDISSLRYDKTKEGGVQKTLNNAVNYLLVTPELSKTFRLNIFSGMIEIDSSAPWYKERGELGPNATDQDVTLLRYELAKRIRVEFSTATMWDAVIVVAHRKHYHPVRNYLNSLQWDGIPRLDTWLSTYLNSPDTKYTRAISRKVLCAAVKRVFQPGCKWDYVLVLEGDQGIGKSGVVNILGKLWSGNVTIDPRAKDTISDMAGKWVFELAEMAVLGWADSAALKSFITKTTDTMRPAYGRTSRDYPRQSIFIGTVNPENIGYLKDKTGNRRFWCVPTYAPFKFVDLENDRDQLYAEAMMYYEKEVLFLTGEADEIQKVEVEARMPQDAWRHLVQRWLANNQNIDEVSPIEVIEYGGIPIKTVSQGDIARMAHNIAGFGWQKSHRTGPGGKELVFIRPISERISREINSLE